MDAKLNIYEYLRTLGYNYLGSIPIQSLLSASRHENK